MKRLIPFFVVLPILVPGIGSAQSTNAIRLLSPDTVGGKPLMQVLKERRSSRAFSDRVLSLRQMSNLLWAAFGINRPDGHRTAPSAMNWQEIDLYVATKDGLYLYDAKSHSIVLQLPDDVRSKTGTQAFVEDAPLTIVYVADLSKVIRASAENITAWAAADCGFIAQNVYLYCASDGLACVVRGSIDKPMLAKVMGLRPDQQIILAQTVGHFK